MSSTSTISYVRTLLLTSVAMLAFAGNSLLGRLALRDTDIDAGSYTVLRLLAGAVVLSLLAGLNQRAAPRQGSTWWKQGGWWASLALFVYAITFSIAYINLTAATGALLLFGAVQVTMMFHGLWQGEKLHRQSQLGFLLALGGLITLLLPGWSAPPMLAAVLMMVSGAAWALYSVAGRGAQSPLASTASNFLRTVPLALLLWWLVSVSGMGAINGQDWRGVSYAILSGAVTSGLGYAIWYAALPGLKSAQAAGVQLVVPVLTALTGVVLLSEPISFRLMFCSVIILGGVALVIADR